uniref:germ cell nuclear acidic protein n=1 Tax=Euleptes europaea TaxID=460621 RepID=UPI0025416E0D|nr:germ cell nuclear acidic protein [Euleptes europaea]
MDGQSHGYPLRPYLFTLYLVDVPANRGLYNQVHCKMCMIIKQAFGQLKRRFHCLHHTGGYRAMQSEGFGSCPGLGSPEVVPRDLGSEQGPPKYGTPYSQSSQPLHKGAMVDGIKCCCSQLKPGIVAVSDESLRQWDCYISSDMLPLHSDMENFFQPNLSIKAGRDYDAGRQGNDRSGWCPFDMISRAPRASSDPSEIRAPPARPPARPPALARLTAARPPTPGHDREGGRGAAEGGAPRGEGPPSWPGRERRRKYEQRLRLRPPTPPPHPPGRAEDADAEGRGTPRAVSGGGGGREKPRDSARVGLGGWAEGVRPPSLAVIHHSSSSSDDEFEKFLSRMKTPKSATCCTLRAENNSLSDSEDNFFRHLTSKKVFSDSSSDENCVFGKHPPRSPCQSVQKGNRRGVLSASSHEKPLTSRDRPKSSSQSVEGRGSTTERSQGKDQRLRPSVVFGCDSSDDEVDNLIAGVKQKMVFPAAKSTEGQTGTTGQRGSQSSCEIIPAATKSEAASLGLSQSPVPVQHPKRQVLTDAIQVPWMPVRNACQVQGCFLRELSDPKSQTAKEFRTKKEELTQRLYAFYNSTVFEQKLPERMEVSWNKKMRKTAGCCLTGQLKEPHLGQRYARIMLSEKVCDSADRLRDTLIHELCHAAAWLIHGVQDGHGRIWSLYAKKSALIHPELPVMSRCHNYEIKYKFTYECSQCQNTIGRHSKSLDTQRFVCALCQGQLVLRHPTRKDGTPAKAPLTPFAKYVKENYASAKQSQQGLNHGAIMKKLSADFACRP